MDVVDYEVGEFVEGHCRGVDAQVVACGVAPAFVGVKVIEVGAKFVCAFGQCAGLVEGFGVMSAYDALGTFVEWGVDEDVDDIFYIAEHVVGTAPNDYARLTIGKVVDKVALCLIHAVGVAAGRVTDPRHGVKSHREWNDAAHYARHTFVALFEVFDIVAGFFSGLYQQHFVVEGYAEAFGYHTAQGAAAAAEAAAYGDYIFVGKHGFVKLKVPLPFVVAAAPLL